MFEKLKAGIFPMFKRKPSIFCPDESGLLEIAKRPEAESELAELQEYRVKPGSYFPRSVVALIQDWQKTLDKARTHDETTARNGATTLSRNAGTHNDGNPRKYDGCKNIHRSQNVPRS